MNFDEFKFQVEALAKKPINNIRAIQTLISKYYGKIGSVQFDSINKFVVRASRNNKGEVFLNTARCSYNPKFKKIPLQRGNYPRQPVFYCSMFSESDHASTSLTCIMETALEEIKNQRISRCYYTLSRWDLKRRLKLWVLPFSKLSHTRNKDFKSMSDELKKALKKHKKKKEIISAFKYMSEVFCKRNNKKIYYKISSAFFNHLLSSEKETNDSCDGLAYPSANTERAGMNVVLKRELIDDKTLYCTAGTMYALTRNPNDKKRLSILPCSSTSFPDSQGNFHFDIFPTAENDFS